MKRILLALLLVHLCIQNELNLESQNELANRIKETQKTKSSLSSKHKSHGRLRLKKKGMLKFNPQDFK